MVGRRQPAPTSLSQRWAPSCAGFAIPVLSGITGCEALRRGAEGLAPLPDPPSPRICDQVHLQAALGPGALQARRAQAQHINHKTQHTTPL